VSSFDLLTEARIREWLERPKAEREASSPQIDPALPLEAQLFADAVHLEKLARTTNDLDAAMTMKIKARELEMRLMVVLENENRPLAARHFSLQLDTLRKELDSP
jgi:hypothetical protein